MDNSTLKACVTKTLKSAFPHCKVYKDKQGSEVVLPAFFVRYIEVGQISAGMDFHKQTYLVEIRYRQKDDFPENELSSHMDEKGGSIADLLYVISDEEITARAESSDCTVTDGILCIVVTYRIRKRTINTQSPFMNELKERQEVK